MILVYAIKIAKIIKKVILLFAIVIIVLSAKMASGATTVNGLAVIVEFTDYTFTPTDNEISSLLNQPSGYNQWNNIGSVRQFYAQQSNDQFILNAQVLRVKLSNAYSYYNSTSTFDGGQALVNDVVAAINVKYPSGFTNLTQRPSNNALWYFLMIKSGPNGAGVAYGVRDNISIINNGTTLSVKQTCVVGYGFGNPNISVICHELGHHLLGYTDYYNVTTDPLVTNIGHYCVMGSGGSTTTPMPLNPVLRNLNGWITTVTDIDGGITNTYTVTSNSTAQVYRYKNPFNPKEYYLIESLKHGGYYTDVDGDGYYTDEGLAIWYADEESTYPRIKLVQADGFDEMNDINSTHYNKRGDTTDLFDNVRNKFNSDSSLFFKWKDGSQPGLLISNVSAPGATMTFTVNGRANTISANSDPNGTILPKGLINVANGHSQTFNFIPNSCFGVKDVIVDGVSQGNISSYTFTNVDVNHSIYVSYDQQVTTIPLPWLRKDIGSISPPSISCYDNGTFRVETMGSDIYWNSDNFHFIYRTLNGDGEIIARVKDMNTPQGWTKSGIMIRESLSADSKHIMMVKTISNGIATQFRLATTGSSDNKNDPSLSTIKWLKIKRLNSEFTTYYSSDGINWTLFDTRTISMNTLVAAGICTTGATATIPNISLFDNVSLSGSTNAYLINSSVFPASSGITSGNGSYVSGATVVLHATALSGYNFVNWTENGNIVSSNSTYTFSANTDRPGLVANFAHISTGIQKSTKNELFKIFPNPSDGRFNINLENDFIGQTSVYIYSLNATCVKEFSFYKSTHKISYDIDLTTLPKGIYYINVVTKDENGTEMLILQ